MDDTFVIHLSVLEIIHYSKSHNFRSKKSFSQEGGKIHAGPQLIYLRNNGPAPNFERSNLCPLGMSALPKPEGSPGFKTPERLGQFCSVEIEASPLPSVIIGD